MREFRRGKIAAIRHKMTPSIGYQVTPENKTGIRTYRDANGGTSRILYFENGVFGTVNQTKQQNVTFSLQNNVEMKVNTVSDTGAVKRKLKYLKT